MDQRERRGVALGGVLVSVAGLGASLSGCIQPALGIPLMIVGVMGAVTAFVWDWWPDIRSRLGRRPDAGRLIAANLRSDTVELEQLCHQSKGNPAEDAFSRAYRAAERANALLVPWKRRVLEYLDAAISRDAAIEFHRLGTTRSEGSPGSHVLSSYEAHRSFLDRLAADVERGDVRVNQPLRRSGELLPEIENFVFKPPRTDR